MTDTVPVPNAVHAPRVGTNGTRTALPLLEVLWRRRALAVALVIAAGAISGVIWASAMPRGPTNSWSGLTLMATGLLLGAIAGLALRRRVAVLLVLLAHGATFELCRWPVDGPVVDGIHLDSTYGVIAFVTGRAFDGALLALPALIGVLYGAGTARRWAGSARGRHPAALVTRRALAALFTVAVVAFAVLVAQPASTAPITSADGAPISSSIAELTTVRLGGHDTTVMLRGQSAAAPVLLYLAGGPGGTDLGAMRLFGSPLERDFVVATWDQRGAGTSYGSLDPTSTLTMAQAVRDTIELADRLRERFEQDRVYLIGNSYGTLLGVLAVQQRPDLFAAFVGAGQMVDPAETDREFYADTLEWARRAGDVGLVETLERNGPPPYDDLLSYEPSNSHERDWNAYPRVPAYAANGELPANLLVEEYDLVQKVRGIPSFIDTFSVLYPQLQDLDFRTQAARLQVPVYIVTGEHEARGRIGLARDWFDTLDAPSKRWIELPESGHRPHFEQPALFSDVMRTILVETRPGGSP